MFGLELDHVCGVLECREQLLLDTLGGVLVFWSGDGDGGVGSLTVALDQDGDGLDALDALLVLDGVSLRPDGLNLAEQGITVDDRVLSRPREPVAVGDIGDLPIGLL